MTVPRRSGQAVPSAQGIHATTPADSDVDRLRKWIDRTEDGFFVTKAGERVGHLIGSQRANAFPLSNLLGPASHYVHNVINERLKGQVSAQLAWVMDEQETGLFVVPGNLLGGMWLQFDQAIAEKRIHKRCKHCGRWFEISLEGHRRTRLFCSVSCKSKDYRERTSTRAKQGESRRRRRSVPREKWNAGGSMLYRRGRVWWYKFQFAGRQFQESSRSRSKAVATRAERQRRRELEEGINGLKRRTLPQPFSVAAAEWLEMKKPTLALKSHRIEKTNLGHLRPRLGKLLLTDIGADEVARYQRYRQREGAAPKTINLEVGTLRAILRRHRLWAQIQPDVKCCRSATM